MGASQLLGDRSIHQSPEYHHSFLNTKKLIYSFPQVVRIHRSDTGELETRDSAYLSLFKPRETSKLIPISFRGKFMKIFYRKIVNYELEFVSLVQINAVIA